MKFRWDKKYLYWGITAFLVICAGICFYYLIFHRSNFWSGIQTLLGIAMPILDGFVLAYLLAPILNHIEQKLLYPFYAAAAHTDKGSLSAKEKKNLRKVGICITIAIVLVCLYCFFSILIPELITSIQSILLQFPYYLQNLNEWILDIFDSNPDLEEIADTLVNRYSYKLEEWVASDLLPQANYLLRFVSSGLIGSVIGFAKALWNLLIGFIISIYLLAGKEIFAGQGKKMVYSFFSVDTANVFVSNVRFIHRTFIGFIIGKIVDSIIIGIICYFGTNLIGTPYPILISVIVGVTNVIPFFGPYMGAIPSAILILMVDPLQCFYFIIFILVLQQFDGNILGPKILGNSTGLNSFWVIFAITVFGGLLGVLGMIIGVPVFAVIYAGIRAVTNRRLEEKSLPTDTKEYISVRSIEENGVFSQYAPRPRKNKKKANASGVDSENVGNGQPQIGFGDSWLLLKRKRKAETPADTAETTKTTDHAEKPSPRSSQEDSL